MKTQLITDPIRAAKIVRDGGLVAFPTETVFGLGADATSAPAIARLFAAKGRPTDNPLIVHVPDINQVPMVGRGIPESASRLLTAFAPGPITVVIPKQPAILDDVTAGFDTVGVRIPDHVLASEFLRHVGLPVAAPSANRSGKPSGTSVEAVLEDLDGCIDAILVGEVSSIGLESTVVDCSVQPPRLLRSGAIGLEQLRSVLPAIEIPPATSIHANSPGLRYAHYQPQAQVQLFELFEEISIGSRAACLSLQQIPQASLLGFYRQFDDVEHYAREFYESLRQADRMGVTMIYCQKVREVGIGRALSDRMHRAAGR